MAERQEEAAPFLRHLAQQVLREVHSQDVERQPSDLIAELKDHTID